jgi:hypothetical protein
MLASIQAMVASTDERQSRQFAASEASTMHSPTFTQPSRDTAPYREAWWIHVCGCWAAHDGVLQLENSFCG